MELNAEGGIYLTREEYRKCVDKVMDRQAKMALIATLETVLGNGIDPEKVADSVNQALGLQVQALENMERVLFGKATKKQEADKND